MRRYEAELYETEIPVLDLYAHFLRAQGEGTGTIVLHHGRVKRPGKVVPSFAAVRLEVVVPDPETRLGELCRNAVERFGLDAAFVAHRVGTVGPRDTVLVAIVSSPTRDRAFDACRFLVDEIKREEILRLVELPA
ncbi:molybdenum cofactor biosynthesis protein MoaE [Deferrisoma palaeochoriense]